jgi:gamma-glutamylcyclotransferase
VDAEDINGRPFRAMTYIADGKEVDSRPSLRYVTLLRDGARSHGLSEHYIRFLDDVEAAQ